MHGADGRMLGWLARLFRNALLAPPDGRLLQRSLLVCVVSVCGSLALMTLAYAVGAFIGRIERMPGWDGELAIDWLDGLGIVLVAPVVETAVLGAMLAVLARAGWSLPVTAAVAGLVWGGLHALMAPFWFFGTAFSFFVFACGWLTWRRKSRLHAFAAAMLPHAMQNLLVFATLMLDR